MQKKAISVSLKASRLQRGFLLVLIGLQGWLLLEQPHPLIGLLAPVLVLTGLHYYRIHLGHHQPVRLEWSADRLELITREGEIYELGFPPLWISYAWLVFPVKRGPWTLRTWVLWPDSLSAVERHQVRLRVQVASRATSGPV